jgi:spermidine synthase
VGTVVLLGGFIEIVLEFLLILGFQVFYGYAYLQLGILITAFMVGLTIGSSLMTHILDRLKKPYFWYSGIQISYFIYPLFIILLFTRINISFWPAKVVEFIFILLTLIAGLMGGFQFPIATGLFLSKNQKWKGQAGLLYGLDLIGSAFGAILASSYLVPIFGIVATLGVLSLMGGIGLSLLLVNI